MRVEKFRSFLKNLLCLLNNDDVDEAKEIITKQLKRLESAKHKRSSSVSPSRRNGLRPQLLISPRKSKKLKLKDVPEIQRITLNPKLQDSEKSPRNVSFHLPIEMNRNGDSTLHSPRAYLSKLERIESELIETERAYVLDLKTIIEVFKKPLQSGNILNNTEITVLFSNIETLLPINQELLRKFEHVVSLETLIEPVERRRSNAILRASIEQRTVISVHVEQENIIKSIAIDCRETGVEIIEAFLKQIAWDEERLLQLQSDFAYCVLVDKATRKAYDLKKRLLPQITPCEQGKYPTVILKRSTKDVTNIGECFLQMGEYLKIYGVYCTNQEKATAKFKKLFDEDDDFYHFTRECMKNPAVRSLELDAFLIKPLQRLCKYPLFLRELLRETPADAIHYPSLVAALQTIENAVASINQRKRQTEVFQEVIDLQERIKGQTDFKLFEPQRKLIESGEAFYLFPESASTQKICFFYLFSDSLVILDGKLKKSKIIFLAYTRDILHIVDGLIIRIKALEKEKTLTSSSAAIILHFTEIEIKETFVAVLENQGIPVLPKDAKLAKLF